MAPMGPTNTVMPGKEPSADTHLLQGGPGADEVKYELVGIFLHPGGDVSIHLGREGGHCWAGEGQVEGEGLARWPRSP